MTPLPPWWKPAAGIIAVLALAWYVDGCYEDRYQQEIGAAEEAHERAERAVEALESLSVTFSRRDAERADSIVKLRAEYLNAERRVEAALNRERRAREVLAEAERAVDEVVHDTVTARLIREERAAHEREKRALRQQIGELEVQLSVATETIEVQASRIEARDELVESLRVALEERTVEAERWREAAEPSFLEGFVNSASQVGTTAVAVLVIVTVF